MDTIVRSNLGKYLVVLADFAYEWSNLRSEATEMTEAQGNDWASRFYGAYTVCASPTLECIA